MVFMRINTLVYKTKNYIKTHTKTCVIFGLKRLHRQTYRSLGKGTS